MSKKLIANACLALLTLVLVNPAMAGETASIWDWQLSLQILGLQQESDAQQALLEGLDTANTNLMREVPSTDAIPGGPNLLVNSTVNSIDPLVHTSTISGGGYENVPQRIGSTTEDPTYVPGLARNATISGGYDNLNNHKAGTIAGGAHHLLAGAGDHGTIGGGSTNRIFSGSYSTIAGGGGASTPQSIAGTRSVIGGGGGNNVAANYAVISGGLRNSVDGNASAVAGGRDNAVYAEYALAAGRNVQINARAEGSVAAGRDVNADTPGSINISARGQFGQSILFNMGNQTNSLQNITLINAGDDVVARIPAGSVWSGEAHVVGVDQTGAVAALKTSFTATDGAVIYSQTTKLVDQIGLVSMPASVAVNSLNRNFEYTVTGAAGSTINWNGTVVVTQAN